MESVLIRANAKINLDLRILDKRPDGYHNLKSVFQSVDLSDFLLFEKAKDNEFTGAIICPEAKNIILKAETALERKVGKKLPCKIHLQKAIPISAGLGGGSSDAAATLFALNYLYKLGLQKSDLAKVGSEIGADVPFFFYGGTCLVQGFGEKVTPSKRKLPKFFVLFRPHKRMETKMVFELYDKTGRDLLEINKEVYPEMKKLEEYLNGFPSKEKGLSGTGPTMFCSAEDYKSAQNIAYGYPDFNGDIFICRPQKEALKAINYF